MYQKHIVLKLDLDGALWSSATTSNEFYFYILASAVVLKREHAATD